jgi:hypothetical protein
VDSVPVDIQTDFVAADHELQNHTNQHAGLILPLSALTISLGALYPTQSASAISAKTAVIVVTPAVTGTCHHRQLKLPGPIQYIGSGLTDRDRHMDRYRFSGH